MKNYLKFILSFLMKLIFFLDKNSNKFIEGVNKE